MAEIIPEEKILEIRNAVDIVDIVSESVLLKKAGKNFVGLCPFHAEKTPSFTVSTEKQIFYCFGCGAGGNLFRFLMKREGMTFPETVRTLARRAGIEIPRPNLSPTQKRRASEREQLLKANRAAAEYYFHSLTRSAAGKRPMNYLADRGMSRKTIDEFQLGYAPGGWDNLINYFKSKGVPSTLQEKAGLVVPRKDRSGFYDRFRDRIIFPIHSLGKQVIGFGGRVMDDSLPKYLNSPETPVYSKSRSLYGLSLARGACRQAGSVFIVEGYFDLLALFRFGIRNAVATLGTALTDAHVRMLRGFAKTVVLVFDSDAAGIKAALRSIDLFIRESVDARIAVLPAGEDPDSFIRERGADEFKRVAAEAKGIFPFLIESAVATHGLTVDGKVRVVSEIVPSLAAIDDHVAQSLYVKELAERVGVDERPIMEKVRQAGSVQHSKRTNAVRSSQATAPAPERPRERGKRYRLERQIVAMMLQFPQILADIEERRTLNNFEDADLEAIGRAVLNLGLTEDHSERGVQAADLVELIEDENRKQLAARLSICEEPWDMDGCLRLLDQYEVSWRRRKYSMLAEIKAAEDAGDQERLFRLLQDKQQQAKAKF